VDAQGKRNDLISKSTLSKSTLTPFLLYDDYLVGSDYNDVLTGRDGNDILLGGAGDDRLDGGYGNDRLEGGQGNDTLLGSVGDDAFVMARDGGQDVITDLGGNDVLEIGATLDELQFQRGGDLLYDLQIRIGNQSAVTIKEHYLSSGRAVETLRFSDGSTLDLTNGLTFTGTENAETMPGTAYNDRLFGLGGEDVLDAKEGNDTLDGGFGNDTLKGGFGDDAYYVNIGHGDDLIDEDGGNDRLVVDATLDQISFMRTGTSNGDLVIRLADQGSVTIKNHYTLAASRVESLQLGDGVIVDLTGGLPMMGTQASETMLGTDDVDALYGLGGDDVKLAA
jgi:Ca2+-binding RTX toxin-like protein